MVIYLKGQSVNRRNFLENAVRLSAMASFSTASSSLGGGNDSRNLAESKDYLFGSISIPSHKNKHVAVVGAGIAGLTAAYLLKKSGFSVTVFESNSFVGGRMSSYKWNDHVVDRGAQFFPQGFYKTLVPLISELKLENEVITISPYASVIRDGLPKKLKTTNLLSIFNELFKIDETNILKLATGFISSLPKANHFTPSDITQWIGVDKNSAHIWSQKFLNSTSQDYLAEGLIAGLSFQEPNEVSQALLIWIINFFLRAGELRTFKNGMGTLTQALAGKLDVQVNTEVIRIIDLKEKSRVVLSNGDCLDFDSTILAAPGPISKKILSDMELHGAEKAVLESGLYKRVLNLEIQTSRNWRGHKSFNAMTFMVIPKRERQLVYSLTQDFRAFDRADEMFQVFCSPAEKLNGSEHSYFLKALSDLERFYPGISKYVTGSRHDYFEYGTPIFYVGKSQTVKNYREFVDSRSPLHVLAGDSLGFYGTDGAAFSGIQAARHIIKTHLNRFP